MSKKYTEPVMLRVIEFMGRSYPVAILPAAHNSDGTIGLIYADGREGNGSFEVAMKNSSPLHSQDRLRETIIKALDRVLGDSNYRIVSRRSSKMAQPNLWRMKR